mmetsp:Transcript_42920/g.104977  ORF Transcript_42920/g.104977 Transcript_42920/m.104977 type:complete len:224 (-) Transcript_42920:13-684(-)
MSPHEKMRLAFFSGLEPNSRKIRPPRTIRAITSARHRDAVVSSTGASSGSDAAGMPFMLHSFRPTPPSPSSGRPGTAPGSSSAPGWAAAARCGAGHAQGCTRLLLMHSPTCPMAAWNSPLSDSCAYGPPYPTGSPAGCTAAARRAARMIGRHEGTRACLLRPTGTGAPPPSIIAALAVAASAAMRQPRASLRVRCRSLTRAPREGESEPLSLRHAQGVWMCKV